MTRTATIPARRGDLRSRRILALLTALALGTISLLLVSPVRGYAQAQLVICVAQTLFGIWVFWTHGRRWITAAGIYSLASVGFVGYAGVWWLQTQGDQLLHEIYAATAVCYFTHLAMYALFWLESDKTYPHYDLGRASPDLANWMLTVGLAISVVSVAVMLWRPIEYVRSLAFVGLVLLALALMVRPGRLSFTPGRFLVLGGSVYLYVVTVFSGYGRLTVVVLAACAGIAAATRLPRRWMKACVLIGAPFLVVALNGLRARTVEELYGRAAGSEQGPDSSIGPLATFAQLIAPNAAFSNGDGSTFWATLTVFVPRSWWSEKPLGFGSVLTEILRPDLVGTGHSMAALATGEWYYNWGWLGVVAMVPVTGLAVRWLDLFMGRVFTHRNFVTRRDAMRLAIVVLAAGGVADYVWVGTFTFMARTGARVGLILIVFAAFGALRSERRGVASAEATGPGSVRAGSGAIPDR